MDGTTSTLVAGGGTIRLATASGAMNIPDSFMGGSAAVRQRCCETSLPTRRVGTVVLGRGSVSRQRNRTSTGWAKTCDFSLPSLSRGGCWPLSHAEVLGPDRPCPSPAATVAGPSSFLSRARGSPEQWSRRRPTTGCLHTDSGSCSSPLCTEHRQ